ncbi:MAG TPA: hypothetical protein VFZ46_01390 [Nitrososphaeraceae archaeon]
MLRTNIIIYTGREKTPPNNIIFPQLEFKILEKSPSIFTNNNRKPEIKVMVEIGIMNLCTRGKRIDKDPALFIGLNMKITKNVILHHKMADKK